MVDAVCNVCGTLATVLDTEYEEYYCYKHAQEYNVLDSPYVESDEGFELSEEENES